MRRQLCVSIRLLFIAFALAWPAGPARADTPGAPAASSGALDAAATAARLLPAEGDGAAELAMGDAHEQRGDYGEAVRLYARAAERGSATALYRLALIALAGNKDFAPDHVEAYKWSILAAAKPGSEAHEPAVDLEQLLRHQLSAVDLEEGRKRAKDWRDRLKQQKPTADPQPLPPLPPSPPPPPDRTLKQIVRSIECASLNETTEARGKSISSVTVPDEQQRKILALAVARDIPPEMRPELQVKIVPPPLCQTLRQFDRMREAYFDPVGLKARLSAPNSILQQGDPIRIEVNGESQALRIRIDYFSLNGLVLHMLPNDAYPTVVLPPAAQRVFDSGRPGEKWMAGGAPFGTELIVVLGTPEELDIGIRPNPDRVTDYLQALEAALRGAPESARTLNRLATILVHTFPRPQAGRK